MTDQLASLSLLLSDVILPNLKAVQASQAEQIAANDHDIQELRRRQKRCKPEGEKYLEIEREIDRLVAKIAKDIRTIDFSVQTRNRLVDFLKDIDKQFSRFEQDIKRAQTALKRETNEDLKALIGAAPAFGGPGFLVPTRNGDLLRWCLEQGLRITQTMTLMSVGLYNEPQGAWLPSIAY